MEGIMNRLAIIIVGSIILFGTLTGIYYSWRKGIEREALLEYNQKQLEQNLKDQEELRKKMEAVTQQQEEIRKKTEEDKKAFENKINNAREYINTEEAKKSDRPSSEILKQTVKKLKDAPK